MFNIFRRKNKVENFQGELSPSDVTKGLEKAFKDGFPNHMPETPDHLKPSEWALNKQKELRKREIAERECYKNKVSEIIGAFLSSHDSMKLFISEYENKLNRLDQYIANKKKKLSIFSCTKKDRLKNFYIKRKEFLYQECRKNLIQEYIVIFSKFSWYIDYNHIEYDYGYDSVNKWGHNTLDSSHIFIRNTGEYVYMNYGQINHVYRPYDIIEKMSSISNRFNIKLINGFDSFSVDTHEFKQDGTEIIKQEG